MILTLKYEHFLEKVMKKYNKVGIWALSLSFLTAMQVQYAIANVQDVDEEVVIETVKHKVIQLKKMTGQPTVIEIEEDGKMRVIELTADELADKSLLGNKLAGLDPETRETVMNALNHSGRMPHRGSKMVKSHGQKDGVVKEIHFKHMDTDDSEDHEIVFIDAADDISFNGELKGHYKVVVKLIEKGKFSKQELDEIRAALDAKY